MGTTQDGRLLKIETPLGKDYLLLSSFYATEELSGLFKYDVELLHEEPKVGYVPTDIDITTILGKDVTITVSQTDGVERTFNGIVNTFSKRNRNNRFSFYTASIVPKIWLLTQKSQSRIFQHKTAQQILEEVFQGYQVSFEIQGTFEKRTYCVQYRETDFAFASRLMEEEGFYYYFEQQGGTHKMIVANTPQSHQDNPGKNEISYNVELEVEDGFVSHVRDMIVDFTLQTGKIANRDYNFQLNTNKLESTLPSLFNVGGNQELEAYDYPGGYSRKYDGIDRGGGESPGDLQGVFPDKDRTVENAMQVLDAQYEILSSSSDCATFTAGHRFKLKKHPNNKLNRQYVLTSVAHHAEQSPGYISDEFIDGAYSNNFRCIPHGSGAPPFRPPRRTPKPIVQGSQTAVVVGPPGEEIFTDKYGRVKVQFHWDRTDEPPTDTSCWMRVVQPWAGKDWGSICIPRVGHEVVVEFLEGDPDQPVVSGSVYNPTNMPPYTLPDNANMMGFKSNTTKGGGGYNEIAIVDGKAGELIRMHAQKDMDTTVLNDDTQYVINNRIKTVDGRQDETIKKDKTTTVTEGDQSTTVKTGSKSTTVKQGVEIKSEDSNVTIKAKTHITLDVGGNKIIIDKDGSIKVQASASTDITAPKNHIGGTTKMDGGDVFIN